MAALYIQVMDTAEGLHYLHNLDPPPPVFHGDLKSVSDQYIWWKYMLSETQGKRAH